MDHFPLPNTISGDGLTYTWDAVDFEIAIEITKTPLPRRQRHRMPFIGGDVYDPCGEHARCGVDHPDAAVCEGDIATLVAEVVSVEGASTTLAWTSLTSEAVLPMC